MLPDRKTPAFDFGLGRCPMPCPRDCRGEVDVAQLQLPAHRLGPQPTTDLDGRRVGPGSVSHSLGGVTTTRWSNSHPLEYVWKSQKVLVPSTYKNHFRKFAALSNRDQACTAMTMSPGGTPGGRSSWPARRILPPTGRPPSACPRGTKGGYSMVPKGLGDSDVIRASLFDLVVLSVFYSTYIGRILLYKNIYYFNILLYY